MNLKDIKEIITLVDSSSLTEFKLEMEDVKLSVKKETEVRVIDNKEMNTSVVAGSIEGGAEDSNTEGKYRESTLGNEENLHIIKSPIVGVFYNSPGPGAAPFVKAGDRVRSGEVLCIIEAMKLMNEINSDIDGEIVEVLVENQSPVEYGQPLFSIRKV